jgi:hypothetical protein
MLESMQTIDVLAAICILAGLASVFIFGIRALRRTSGLRQNDRRTDPRYAHLLRKLPF